MYLQISDAAYSQLGDFLERRSGIVLGANKKYLVISRLTPLVDEFRLGTLDRLVKEAVEGFSPRIRTAVLDAMTTNETLWFRDGYPFEILKETIFPELKDKCRLQPIRIWSAACSSGQEPYSIAITAIEAQNLGRLGPLGVHITATDLSETVLAKARSGRYDGLAIERGLSLQKRRMYFRECGNSGIMEVVPAVKRSVSFRHINLLESFASLGNFEVVFCRNVLIYFSQEVTERIIRQIADVLVPGGYLFLGSSESMSVYDKFEMIHLPHGIVYRRKDGGAAKPTLPVRLGS